MVRGGRERNEEKGEGRATYKSSNQICGGYTSSLVKKQGFKIFLPIIPCTC